MSEYESPLALIKMRLLELVKAHEGSKESDVGAAAYSAIRGLQAENQRLKALNYRLNTEYKKTWEVLRTYNPKDTELEYIVFETVGVLDAPDQ